MISDTTVSKNGRSGNPHRREDGFVKDERGRPVRKPKQETGLPA